MSIKIQLLSPRIAVQKSDFLGSGVPYWPLEFSIFASFLREDGHDIHLIDLFGENPKELNDYGQFYLQGNPIDTYIGEMDEFSPDIFILYAISYMSHEDILNIINFLRKRFPKKLIFLLENSQAVTAFSLSTDVKGKYFAEGCDYIICGEPYHTWEQIKLSLIEKSKDIEVQNVISSKNPDKEVSRMFIQNYKYPFPAWELINLNNYWMIPYSHGPKKSKYLPIQTSRGCTFSCDFCVVPSTNSRKFRPREPVEVVKEIEYFHKKYKVKHFQVEDLNPTIGFKRWVEICNLLIEKQLKIYFYFVSGTKAETIPINCISLLAKAGCRYISISPESGSSRLMKIIGKNFNYDHGLKFIEECYKNNIATQACFLVGHPSETAEDFKESKKYLKKLIKKGLTETAIFIVSPFAGSQLYQKNKISYSKDSFVSFSPKGRSNYTVLNKRRSSLIRLFFIEKILFRGSLFFQGVRAILGKPNSKMENLPLRIIFIYKRILMNWIFKQGKKR